MFLKLKKVKKANINDVLTFIKSNNKCLFQRQQHLCFDLIMTFVERRNVIVLTFFNMRNILALYFLSKCLLKSLLIRKKIFENLK